MTLNRAIQNLTCTHVVEECKSDMDSIAQGVQKSLTFIAKQASEVSYQMTEKLGTRMDNLVLVINKSLETKDEIYFKKIDGHATVVKNM